MKKVLRFTAGWCQPCKMLAKNLEGISVGFPIEVIDIDDTTDTAMVYGVRSVPTMIMIGDDGQELKRHVGVMQKQDLENWLNG